MTIDGPKTPPEPPLPMVSPVKIFAHGDDQKDQRQVETLFSGRVGMAWSTP